MKKFLCVLLSLLCVFALSINLTACGDNNEGTAGLKYELQDDGTYFVSGIDTKTENIVIPSSYNGKQVTGVAEDAFITDRTLKQVTLPSSVYVIEGSAFYNCSALEKINLENVSVIEDASFRNTKLSTVNFNNLQKVGKNAFNGCSKLKTVEFPAGVSEIGQSAFSGCSLLNTVNFKGTVNVVGVNAFSGCSLLRNINLEKIKYFNQGCFQSCVSLENINLANAVEIEPYAFKACTKLTSVILGANLIYIHKDAMKDCEAVSSIEVINKEGWYNVGTCARCFISEGGTLQQASVFDDTANNVSMFIATDWAHNYYLCKQEWINKNRPNGWNKNKGDYCGGCGQGSV